MIGILDVGVGNVAAIEGAYRRLILPSCRVTNARELSKISHLILPGVGSMGEYMSRIKHNNLYRDIINFARSGFVFGICLGFQSLFEYSQEDDCEAFGFLSGSLNSLNPDTESTNIGNYKLEKINECKFGVFSDADLSHAFYFTHSYYLPASNPASLYAIYSPFKSYICASVESPCGHIYGTQYHPELSHEAGRNILKRFSDLT